MRLFLARIFPAALLASHRSRHLVFPVSSSTYNTAINTEHLVPRIRPNSLVADYYRERRAEIFPDVPLSPAFVFPEVIVLTTIITTVQRSSGEKQLNNDGGRWGPTQKNLGTVSPENFSRTEKKVKVFPLESCI